MRDIKTQDFFSKALQARRRFEDSEDVCGLCLKLKGSSEDRKISSAIAEWVKGKKYDKESDRERESRRTVQAMFHLFLFRHLCIKIFLSVSHLCLCRVLWVSGKGEVATNLETKLLVRRLVSIVRRRVIL